MSIPSEHNELAGLSDGALSRQLGEAELRERSLSDRRSRLQALIDTSPTIGEGAPEDDFRVAALLREERELSAKRLQLHQRIHDLRLETSRRIDAVRTPLRAIDSPNV